MRATFARVAGVETDGGWCFTGFTPHEEAVTEREERAAERSQVISFAAIDLSDFEGNAQGDEDEDDAEPA